MYTVILIKKMRQTEKWESVEVSSAIQSFQISNHLFKYQITDLGPFFRLLF